MRCNLVGLISYGPICLPPLLICQRRRVMPAALVPRPWDFGDPPALKKMAVKDISTDGPEAGVRVPIRPGEALFTPVPPTLTVTPATLPRGTTVEITA
jgi:hypothetical protein